MTLWHVYTDCFATACKQHKLITDVSAVE